MSNTVPKGWQVRSIGKLVTLQYGKSPKDVITEDGQYPVIGTGGVTARASSYLYDGCTTVIGRKGTINKPSYVEGKFWAIDTTYFGTCYKDAEPKWFYYSLNSFDLSKYNEASGVPSLGRDTLNAIPLLAPPLPEQQKIVSILSSVDDVIEKTRAQIDKLKDLKTGMMQELLTKGIGSGGVPHTEFKDSKVGQIPLNWSIVTIADCTTRFYQGINTVADKVVYIAKGTPIIQVKHMTSGHLNLDNTRSVSDADYEKYKRKFQPCESDILFSNIGTIGKSVIIEREDQFLIAWNVFLMRIEQYVTPKYMHYVLQYLDWLNFYDDLMTGNATKFVNKSSLGAISIRVPPREEQEKITASIGTVDNRVKHSDQKLHALVKVKKALMQDLLTGKVRVEAEQKESAVA